MSRRMTPMQVGFAWGVPAGLLLGFMVLTTGELSANGAIMGSLSVLFAVAFGVGLVGGIAAFVQWRRLAKSLGDVAPPGWYDSPEDDGTQWFWTGTRWTDRTRSAQPRTKTRRL